MDFNESLEKLKDVNFPKLKEYEVRVTETIVKTVYVEARDWEDAEQLVDEMISNGEIDIEHNFDDYSRTYEAVPCDPDEEDEYE